MKKKILALILCAMMAATAVVGGTLAYFTDTDADINVMTAGNVKIQQDEWQRTVDNEGNITGYEEYKNNKPLFPYTGTTDDKGVATGGYPNTLQFPTGADTDDDDVIGNETGTVSAFDTKNNAIDKMVTVTNKGTMPAYIRTLFAFEIARDKDDDTKIIYPFKDGVDMLNYTMRKSSTYNTWHEDIIIKVGNVEYAIGEYYYKNNTVDNMESALAAGYTSDLSLGQIYMGSKVGNEWYDLFGEEYNILVLSQAAQMTGFTSAENALDTAFADITVENTTTIQGWFESIAKENGVSVDTVHPSAVENEPATDGMVATTNP